MGPTICIIHRNILLMILLRLNLFHFAIVEDREVFPGYELSRPGNAGIAGYGQFAPGQAEPPLLARGPAKPCLMGGILSPTPKG
jgi:hypothetical protein